MNDFPVTLFIMLSCASFFLSAVAYRIESISLMCCAVVLITIGVLNLAVNIGGGEE